MAIEMKDACIHNPIALELFGQERKPAITFPKYRALTGGFDKDECLLARAPSRGEQVSFHSEALELLTVERRGVILADLSNVPRTQAPTLACRHRCSNLATQQSIGGENFHLRSTFGKTRNRDMCIGSIQANTNHVYFWNIHCASENTLSMKTGSAPKLPRRKEEQ
jgi:hypothetical protein